MTAGNGAGMTSNRPYLIRAMYDWISDNGMTPYLLVDASYADVEVPRHSVKDGRVVLNVASQAVANLELGNQMIRFMARFSGVSQVVQFPVQAVQAIYAQETGQGMMLPQEEAGAEGSPAPEPDGTPEGDGPRRPHLRVVK
jgi:stringent starvation protein B